MKNIIKCVFADRKKSHKTCLKKYFSLKSVKLSNKTLTSYCNILTRMFLNNNLNSKYINIIKDVKYLKI